MKVKRDGEKMADRDDRDKQEIQETELHDTETKDEDEKDIDIINEIERIAQENKKGAIGKAVEARTKATAGESGIKVTVSSSTEASTSLGSQGAGKGGADSSGTGSMHDAAKQRAWKVENADNGRLRGEGQNYDYFMPSQGLGAGTGFGGAAVAAGVGGQRSGYFMPGQGFGTG
uniref:Uncharacterized protein n=1 Tax=Elaeophora elaphi TaxID=1147741 RepID=A0A0R3RM78_9BILA